MRSSVKSGAAALLLSAAVAAPAAVGAPARAASASAAWQTCLPRKTDYIGIYRADNDLFADARGQSCITVNGTALTIDQNYRRQPAIGVVAYPKVYVGQNYLSGDRAAPFPLPVTGLGALALHVRATGRAKGVWLSDSDDWFFPSAAAVTGHGNAELVIGIRYTSWRPTSSWRRMSIDHHWYWASHRLTCDPAHPKDCWPLTVFRLRHRVRNLTIPMSDFSWHMRQLGWLRSTEWLGNVAFGTECWSGCAGLTDQLTLTGMTGLSAGRETGSE